jgi:hypothetical protein
MRSIYDLTTHEAYHLVRDHFGHELPPLDAVENEDWGRDYVLQYFQRHTAAELAEAGLQWDAVPEPPQKPNGQTNGATEGGGEDFRP